MSELMTNKITTILRDTAQRIRNLPSGIINSLKIKTTRKMRFWMNVLFGFLITLCIHLMVTRNLYEKVTDTCFDPMISYEANRAANKEEQTNLFFLDINYKDFERWKEPLITPREKIARLIKFAETNGAKIIVVDILLEKPDCCDSQGDNALRRTLKRMLENNSSTTVVFPIRIGSDGNIRSTILDDLATRNTKDGKRLIYFAISELSRTATDLKGRYWTIYKRVNNQGQLDILWTTPMVVSALYAENIEHLEKLRWKYLSTHNNRIENRDTDSVGFTGKKKVIIPPPNSEEASINKFYSQRIRFRLIPPKPNESGFRGSNVASCMLVASQAIDAATPPVENLTNKIVIIGNSSPDDGDIHATPIGPIAGMYILGNSIHTILNNLQPQRLPFGLILIIDLAIILFVSYLFVKFSSLFIKMIASLGVCIVVWWIALVSFEKSNYFYNILIPITGMDFVEIMLSIWDFIYKRFFRPFKKVWTIIISSWRAK